jgi:hypothetical protein
MKFQKVVWLILCFAFLSACNRNSSTPTVELTLTASSSEVASGETVTLTATIGEDSEDVASVEFAVKDGAVISSDDGSDESYTAESAALTEDTTFVAVAKDEDGEGLGSDEVTVTVAAGPIDAPNAEDRTVTTLENVQVVGGGTPTGLAVTTEQLVADNGDAEIVEGSETGGTATVEEDGTFTFTPTPDFSGAASFRYSVVDGANSDEATVTITVTALPENTVVATTLEDIQEATTPASAVTTIIVSGTIVCETDRPVVLKSGQTLTGASEIAGVTLTGTATFDATVSGGNPGGTKITVITLAPDTTVEGLEITGDDLFSALNGVAVNLREPGSPADNPTASTVTVRNVTITGTTVDAPFKIEFTGPPAEDFEAYYDLTIDNLTFSGVAGKPIGFSAFEDLEFRNSEIEISPDATGETGVSLRAYGGPTSVIVEGVTLNSGKGGAGFSPLEVGQSSAGGVLTATVKDTTVTFADDVANADAFPFYFNFGNAAPGDGKIIIAAESTGNTSNTTSGDPIRWTGGAGKIEGSIELNGVDYSRP